ncbi:unnamed protein product [Phytophthora fragariaefolia]|uniref:Unnamed protein product n=1 Tax=Phytophthora fragariaefolia TaxID=1490495 RepID=A0A9W6XIQ1_9STRA|nr:unnamed protein product [Phytophthora fragariaefolia]
MTRRLPGQSLPAESSPSCHRGRIPRTRPQATISSTALVKDPCPSRGFRWGSETQTRTSLHHRLVFRERKREVTGDDPVDPAVNRLAFLVDEANQSPTGHDTVRDLCGEVGVLSAHVAHQVSVARLDVLLANLRATAAKEAGRLVLVVKDGLEEEVADLYVGNRRCGDHGKLGNVEVYRVLRQQAAAGQQSLSFAVRVRTAAKANDRQRQRIYTTAGGTK